MTTEIVSAYLSNNTLQAGEISAVIEQVYKTVANLNTETSVTADRPQPAVPIKRSITPDYIICLEDGKKLKMLKRHLKTAYNMTPEEYRERWGCLLTIRWLRQIMRVAAASWPRTLVWAHAAANFSA